MAREDTIGFKTTKRKPRKPGNGGSGNSNGGGNTNDNKNKTTKQLLLDFMDRQEKFNRTILARLDEHGQIIDHVLTRLVNLESKVVNLEKDVSSVKIEIKRLKKDNNLK